MAATVQDIESALIAKLGSALPELEVEAFPEKPEEYSLLHPVGAVLVQYDGSELSGNALANGGVAQVRTLRFSVVYLVRNLRDSAGCYDVLQRGADALSGLIIAGALTPCILARESFNAEADGVWMYAQSYTVKVRHAVAGHV